MRPKPKFNLINKVIACLKQHEEKRLTAREIAGWIFKEYRDECLHKNERAKNPKNDDASFIQQIIAEIGAYRRRIQEKYPHIKTTEERPRKYYYTEKKDDTEIDPVESTDSSSAVSDSDTPSKESDLYQPLSMFLSSELGIYSKRIDEKKSTNPRGPQGNKWLYPDLVGMEDLSREWHKKIKDIVKQYADKKTKLWSFEVKKSINRSNVREAFFQTVSNSSWADFGYLVALEIADAAMKELRMLSGLHGIGFIRLDMDNPPESQILLPARERSGIDWDAANRLADASKDFLDYIDVVRRFYQTGDLNPGDWSQIPQAD